MFVFEFFVHHGTWIWVVGVFTPEGNFEVVTAVNICPPPQNNAVWAPARDHPPNELGLFEGHLERGGVCGSLITVTILPLLGRPLVDFLATPLNEIVMKIILQ